jgi:hypothetical protein
MFSIFDHLDARSAVLRDLINVGALNQAHAALAIRGFECLAKTGHLLMKRIASRGLSPGAIVIRWIR